MRRFVCVFLVLFLLPLLNCSGDAPTPAGPTVPEGMSTQFSDMPHGAGARGAARTIVPAKTGDNYLTTSFTYGGSVDMVIDVVADAIPGTGGVWASSEDFSISGIPAGATIEKALMYVQRWEGVATSGCGTSTATATFEGNPLGPLGPHAVDCAGGFYFTLQSFRFDVTAFVTGNGSYEFTFDTSAFMGNGQNFYAALVVVFSDASLPEQKIVINDGAEAIEDGSSPTTFAAMPAAGPGTLTIVTQADQATPEGMDTAEEILFNGTSILGPGDIFDGNQGELASLHQLGVDVLAGDNTATVSTASGPYYIDLFGYHIAILEGPAGATDTDGDGVLDNADVCEDTAIPESVPEVRLGVNRFALTDGDGVFDTTAPNGTGPEKAFTIEDTAGCSCEQIIDELGLGKGHRKFGCSISAMEDWVAVVAAQ